MSQPHLRLDPVCLEVPSRSGAEPRGVREGLANPPTPAKPDTRPPRSAWVEVDLSRLRRNFELINRDKPPALKLMAVVKDAAYGHGAIEVARVAATQGIECFGVSTLDEAVALRQGGISGRIVMLGERQEAELAWCVEYDLTCCVGDPGSVAKLGELAARAGKRVPVHLKINTGMNRYGVPWDNASSLAETICATKSLLLEGVMSHLAQSDEKDKAFALVQIGRFQESLRSLAARGISAGMRHLSNSGGFLDLPQAHFDLARIGILPLGVFPSSVCRRIAGIEPVMSVKARIASIQQLQPGDTVSYGMRYTAPSPRRIAVLPLGYGDGFPRVPGQFSALIQGRRAPVVGRVTMDSLMVDITDIPTAQLWDEAVLMGRQGADDISAHEIARIKGSVSYDILTGWRARLPRVYVATVPPGLAPQLEHRDETPLLGSAS